MAVRVWLAAAARIAVTMGGVGVSVGLLMRVGVRVRVCEGAVGAAAYIGRREGQGSGRLVLAMRDGPRGGCAHGLMMMLMWMMVRPMRVLASMPAVGVAAGAGLRLPRYCVASAVDVLTKRLMLVLAVVGLGVRVSVRVGRRCGMVQRVQRQGGGRGLRMLPARVRRRLRPTGGPLPTCWLLGGCLQMVPPRAALMRGLLHRRRRRRRGRRARMALPRGATGVTGWLEGGVYPKGETGPLHAGILKGPAAEPQAAWCARKVYPYAPRAGFVGLGMVRAFLETSP